MSGQFSNSISHENVRKPKVWTLNIFDNCERSKWRNTQKSLYFLYFLVAEIIASGKHLIYSKKVTKETGETKRTRKARKKHYAVIAYFIAKNEKSILQNSLREFLKKVLTFYLYSEHWT